MFYIPLERYFYRASPRFCCIEIHAEMAEKSQAKQIDFFIYIFTGAPIGICDGLFLPSFLQYRLILLSFGTKGWVIKVRHPSLDSYTQKKHITHEDKQYNTHAIGTCIILSLFVIRIFICFCCLERFPILFASSQVTLSLSCIM